MLSELFFVALIALGIGQSEADRNRVWDLEACIERALESSTRLDSLRFQQAVDLIRISEARKRWYPSVTGSLSLIDQNVDEAFADPAEFQSPVSQQALAYSRFIQANVDYPIYAGGSRLAELEGARIQEGLTDTAVELTRSEVRNLVIRAYIDALQAKATMGIQSGALERAQRALETARKKVELGTGIRVEVFGEESFTAQTQSEILQASQSMDAARRALMVLMDLSPREGLIQIADLNLPSVSTFPPAPLIDMAHSNRPEIRQKRQEIAAQEQTIRGLRASLRPQLSANASLTDRSGSLTFRQLVDFNGVLVPLQDTVPFDSPFSWNVGLTLTIPIGHDFGFSYDHRETFFKSSNDTTTDTFSFSAFDGSSQRTVIAESEARLKELQRELSDLYLTITDEVTTALETVQAAGWRIHAAEKALTFNREQFRVDQKRYELGLATYSELLESRGNAVNAEVEVSSARYALFQGLADLGYRAGVPELDSLVATLGQPGQLADLPDLDALLRGDAPPEVPRATGDRRIETGEPPAQERADEEP